MPKRRPSPSYSRATKVWLRRMFTETMAMYRHPSPEWAKYGKRKGHR